MKKKYIDPEVSPIAVDTFETLLISSVKTGDAIHDDYNEDDVTYSRQNVWSDGEGEEDF